MTFKGREPSPEDAQRIKDYLSYCPDTGKITWIKAPCTWIKPGREFGNLTKYGYLRGRVGNLQIMVHRLAWFMYYGACPKKHLDHKNGNRTDNRIINLREVSPLENAKNQKVYKNNKSGVSGVGLDKRSNKWYAEGSKCGKSFQLKLFYEKWDAICARKSWEVKNGYYENHGRPD